MRSMSGRSSLIYQDGKGLSSAFHCHGATHLVVGGFAGQRRACLRDRCIFGGDADLSNNLNGLGVAAAVYLARFEIN
jgi:hypothetical protein